MIFEVIINLFLGIFKGFISLLPKISFTIPSNICKTIAQFFAGITYFFPIKALLPIFTISATILSFRIAYNLILRIKSFIPTMGD